MNIYEFQEPALQFDQDLYFDIFDQKYGLVSKKLGPFDLKQRNFDEVKVVGIGPEREKESLERFWFRVTRGYNRFTGGMIDTFKLREITPITDENYISVEEMGDVSDNIERYRIAIEKMVNGYQDSRFLILVLPQGAPRYLYTKLKTKLLHKRIISQFVRPETLRSNSFLDHKLMNFSLSVYTKYGGVPWNLKSDLGANTCIMGISFHICREERTSAPERTVLGICQILDEFGRHVSIEVKADDILEEDVEQYRRSLCMPAKLARELIAKSLNTYRGRGGMPNRVIIHKTTPFNQGEIDGIDEGFQEVGYSGEYTLIHLQQNTMLRAFRNGYKYDDRTDERDVLRGTLLNFNNEKGILWTVGILPIHTNRLIFAQARTKIGTSNPLGINVEYSNRENLKMEDIAYQVLALTKMRWNTLDASVREPASTYYARKAGNFLRYIWQYDLRFPLDIEQSIDVRYFL